MRIFSIPTRDSADYWPAVKKQVTICSSALEACKNAEAVVIATEWKEFKDIDWEAVYAGMNKPAFVFDGRLLVDADKLRKIGFTVSWLDIFMMAQCSPFLGRRLQPSEGPRAWLKSYVAAYPRMWAYSPLNIPLAIPSGQQALSRYIPSEIILSSYLPRLPFTIIQ